ncbi:hypothetical protein CYMTET_30181, partial [Cymbomonas tetramitiformis]
MRRAFKMTIVWLCVKAAVGESDSGTGFAASFPQGVASGDPLHDAIILWTRAPPTHVDHAGSVTVHWFVSLQKSRSKARNSSDSVQGFFETNSSFDWTVKVEPTGLSHSEDYYYHFVVYGGGLAQSALGHFRLPPPAETTLQRLRYAAFSCSNWGFGYFNAYRVAAEEDLDFWLHLGDWFYEYGDDHYPSKQEAVRHGLDPPYEIIQLDDYRRRHRLYRSDPALQHLSAASPLIAVWDDHEIANNPWVHGAEDHNPGEGSWETRKKVAIQAYHEYMPTRSWDVQHGGYLGALFYRNFTFGNLASLLMLESRLLNRTDPNEIPNVFHTAQEIVGATAPSSWGAEGETASKMQRLKRTLDEYRGRSNKTMLGDAQLQWIERVTNHDAKHTTWQLYGQQTVMQDMYAADLEAAASAPGTPVSWSQLLRNLTEDVPHATYAGAGTEPYQSGLLNKV